MQIQEITSIKDPIILLCRDLTSGAGRRKHRKFLLYDRDQIHWAAKAGIAIDAILTKEREVFDEAYKYISHYCVSEGILKKATETNYLIPIIAVAQYPQDLTAGKEDFSVVLDHVMDPGNIGTIIRTAQSFGINNFISVSQTGDHYQRKIIDASRGSIFKTVFHDAQTPEEALLHLRAKGYQIVVTSPHAPYLQSQVPLEKKPVALIVGNEQHGVSKELMEQADLCMQIPMMSAVESLNVGVATGISLYELQFKMVLLMLREKIVANIGREINLTGQLIRSVFDKKIYEACNLSGMQVILLMIMLCDKTMERAQISRDVSIDAGKLDSFLQPLLERDLIHAQDDIYQITLKGEQFLAQVWPIVEQTKEMILEGIREDEREIFRRVLAHMQNNCFKMLEGH